jgi:hypothetical protein
MDVAGKQGFNWNFYFSNIPAVPVVIIQNNHLITPHDITGF